MNTAQYFLDLTFRSEIRYAQWPVPEDIAGGLQISFVSMSVHKIFKKKEMKTSSSSCAVYFCGSFLLKLISLSML